jgi:hypothetical protein
MNNLYFMGLNLALYEGNYIKVYYDLIIGKMIVLTANANNEVNFTEKDNIISGLNSLSNTIVNETANIKTIPVDCFNIALDNLLRCGYILKFTEDELGNVIGIIYTNNYVEVSVCSGTNLEECLDKVNNVCLLVTSITSDNDKKVLSLSK